MSSAIISSLDILLILHSCTYECVPDAIVNREVATLVLDVLRVLCVACRRSPVLALEHKVLGYGLTRPSDAQVVTGFELVTRT